MSHTCLITGKRTSTGRLVSHSNVKVKRKFYPNLQKKHLINPKNGKKITVVISTKGLRTLQKWEREGKKYDLKAMMKKRSRKD